MPGTGFVGRNTTVRNEVNVDLENGVPTIIEDDPSVHFGELGEFGGCEGRSI